MGHFQNPHLFPTLLLNICSLPKHHVPLLMALHIQMGFPTLEFLPTHCFEPAWLLSCTKYTSQPLPKPKKMYYQMM